MTRFSRSTCFVRSSARLHKQNDRHAEVRRCYFKNPLLFFYGQHSLYRSLPAFIKMLNTGSRALGDVFPSDRELEHAVKTLNLPVNGRSFDGSLWVPLGWLAASCGSPSTYGFQSIHALARQAHREQSQCDFAFPFLEYFHGDFFAGSLGRLK